MLKTIALITWPVGPIVGAILAEATTSTTLDERWVYQGLMAANALLLGALLFMIRWAAAGVRSDIHSLERRADDMDEKLSQCVAGLERLDERTLNLQYRPGMGPHSGAQPKRHH